MQSTILEEQASNGQESSRATNRYLKKIQKKAAQVDSVGMKSTELKCVSDVQKNKIYNEYEPSTKFEFKNNKLEAGDDVYNLDKKFKGEK